MTDTRVPMPNKWWPRNYQIPALQALDSGCRRVLLLHHRRSGKDACTLNWVACAMTDAPRSVLYMFPELGQGIRALFNELNSEGQTHITQAFPEPLLASKPDRQSGIVRLRNGSILQVGGFDSIERYIGSGPSIVVMSEAATSVHAERAWQLLQPILMNNNGVCIFPYTPRGAGFGKDLYDNARGNNEWHCTKLTVDDTNIVLPDGKRLVDVVKQAIVDGEMEHDFAQQEFWCSFTAPNTGAYFARQMEAAEAEGRITDVPHDPALPVFTWWDIGYNDANAIWFVQAHKGGEIRCIDYYEADSQPLSHYLELLSRRRMQGWSFEVRGQLVPHDFAVHEYTTGMTRLQAAQQMGWRMTIVPRPSGIDESIDAARRVLPRCWFDRVKCAAGLVHLGAYSKKWSKQLQMFTGELHDEHSNGASAFRTGVMGMRLAGMHVAKNVSQAQLEGRMGGTSRPFVARTDFSVWS